MAGNEKISKNKKTLLWVGLGILAAGVLAFGGAFALGAMVLARDLLYLAIFADTLIVGGALGKTAVDMIADKVGSKKQLKEFTRERSRQQEREQTQTKESVFSLGEQVVAKDADYMDDEDYQVEGQMTFGFSEGKNETKKNTPKSR